MGRFPFVEGGEAFGVLGDLQQRGGERVPPFLPCRVHGSWVLLTAMDSVSGRPRCRRQVGCRGRGPTRARAGVGVGCRCGWWPGRWSTPWERWRCGGGG